jgi:nitrite reductase/ring-hydroxylating ferredoxin subunit
MKITLFDSIEKARETIPEGEMKIVKYQERKFILAQFRHRFYAFDHLCPHMGHPLNDGRFNPYGEIVCSLHSYRFDLNSGNESQNRCRYLTIYKISEEKNKLMVEI